MRTWNMRPICRIVLVAALLGLFSPLLNMNEVHAAPAWLDYFNSYRALANLPTLTEDASLSAKDLLHARYIVKTDTLTHVEDPASPFFTADGAYAGTHSNVASSSGQTYTYQLAIDGWMTGPFHQIGMLDPRLTQSGFGLFQDSAIAFPKTSAGAALDVLTHLEGAAPSGPVFFPADGKTMPLTSYDGSESPDPLTSCPGYSASAASPTGPPLALQLTAAPAVSAFSLSKVGAGTLAVCEFDETNYANGDAASQSLGRNVLGARHAVILMPKAPLTNGTYRVSVTSKGTVFSWSFGVGGPPSGSPSLTASPQQVPFGQNSTTLAFATGDGSSGTLCVAGNGGPAAPFAGGASGSPQATFINSGSYAFALHAGSSSCTGATLASVTVTKLNPKGTTGPAILATPATFSFATAATSSAQLVRSSTIGFDTGDGSVGQVMLAVNGSTPVLFTASQFGSVTAPWVFSGKYVFTLMKGGVVVDTATAATTAQISTPNDTTAGGFSLGVATTVGKPVPLTFDTGSGQSAALCTNFGGLVSFSQNGAGNATSVDTAGAVIYSLHVSTCTGALATPGTVTITAS